jgi:hypothetical protein
MVIAGSGSALRAAAWARHTSDISPEDTVTTTAKTAPRADREKVMYDSDAR